MGTELNLFAAHSLCLPSSLKRILRGKKEDTNLKGIQGSLWTVWNSFIIIWCSCRISQVLTRKQDMYYFKSISCWTPLSFYKFCGCCENLPSQWGRIYLSPSAGNLSVVIRNPPLLCSYTDHPPTTTILCGKSCILTKEKEPSEQCWDLDQIFFPTLISVQRTGCKKTLDYVCPSERAFVTP